MPCDFFRFGASFARRIGYASSPEHGKMIVGNGM